MKVEEIYAALIKKKIRTINDVPPELRDAVKKILADEEEEKK